MDYMKKTAKNNKNIISTKLANMIKELISINSIEDLIIFIKKYNLNIDTKFDYDFDTLQDKVAFELTEMIFKERDEYFNK